MSPWTRRSPTRASRLPPPRQDAEANGVATNNVAEYSARVAGLRRAVEAGVRELEVRSDSELLFLDASRAERDVTCTHLGREHNELADYLVNEAFDAATS